MSIITIATIKSTIGTADTVEERKFLPFYNSSERTLNRILGDTLFARIVAAAADPGTDVPADDLIDEFIKGFLSWFTYQRSLTRMYAEPDRNGAHYKNDSNTVQADTRWLDQEKKVAGEMRDQFQQDLIDYLDKNSEDGDEWADYRIDTDSANDDKSFAARTTYSGVITRRTVRKCRNEP